MEESLILTVEAANELVLEHRGWAESIARSVARSWNIDWRLDGLDGAAMEALIFCARRFQPARGVPFRGYARKRIHEASSEAARKSRGWRKNLNSSTEQNARDISAELLHIFPELRVGQLPSGFDDGGSGDDARGAIRHLLVGASIVAAKNSLTSSITEEITDYKKMVHLMADLDPIHQNLLWEVYWEGHSMRSVAGEWEVDELSVIREHKSLLGYLQKGFQKNKGPQKLKVRPALRKISMNLRKKGTLGPFSKLLERSDLKNSARRNTSTERGSKSPA